MNKTPQNPKSQRNYEDKWKEHRTQVARCRVITTALWVMQSQSLCHYILWQIPLWSAQFYIYLHTHLSHSNKIHAAYCWSVTSPWWHTSSRVIPSEKCKSVLAERVKLKKSSCEHYNVPVPKADTILCSWGRESYERKVVSSSCLAFSKLYTFPSLSWHLELLSIWITSVANSSSHVVQLFKALLPSHRGHWTLLRIRLV